MTNNDSTPEEPHCLPAPQHGVLVVDKPKGPTSHDVVYKVRRQWKGIGKVGHTGTLDPQATGVLPVMLGKATRLMRFFSQSEKVYEAVIQLGQSTDTYDAQGRILAEAPVPELSDEECRDTLSQFRGTIQQLPPMYSAVKVKGKRLYKEARAGKEVERPSREVTFHDLELQERNEEKWKLQVHCSAGTYVRTLAHDIGQSLGCGAHLASLIRLRSGQFSLDQAVALSDSPQQWTRKVVRLEDLLPEIARLELTPAEVTRIVNGNPVPFNRGEMKPYRLFFQNLLYAVARMEKGQLQPFVVLRTEIEQP